MAEGGLVFLTDPHMSWCKPSPSPGCRTSLAELSDAGSLSPNSPHGHQAVPLQIKPDPHPLAKIRSKAVK